MDRQNIIIEDIEKILTKSKITKELLIILLNLNYLTINLISLIRTTIQN